MRRICGAGHPLKRGALAAACVMLGASASMAQPACWKPGDLAGRAGDSTIRKDTPDAYRAVPRDRVGGSQQVVPRAERGRVIRRVTLPAGQKLVAITFDLCEQPHEISGYQGDIVDILRAERVPATFFASGKWLLTHPERSEQLIADPLFEAGNHAWEHRNFQILDRPRMRTEIGAAQRAYGITHRRLSARACLMPGRATSPPAAQTLFRFPFGACTADAIAEVQAQGLRAVQWDVSAADPWKGMTAEKMIKHVVARVRPGSIVLFHANGRGWHTGAALPHIIARLRARGYRFVTVSQLLAAGTPEYADTCYDARPGDSERYQNVARKLEARYDAFYRRLGKTRPAPGLE